jgi:uncharacterized membrane protein
MCEIFDIQLFLDFSSNILLFLFLWHFLIIWLCCQGIRHIGQSLARSLGFGTIAPSAKKWYNILVLCRYIILYFCFLTELASSNIPLLKCATKVTFCPILDYSTP